MARDFTYVDDLVEAIARLAERPPGVPEADADTLEDGNDCGGAGASRVAPFRVVNIGNNAPVSLLDFILEIERATGCAIQRNNLDMQPGDVPKTWADTNFLEQLIDFRPNTPIAEGVPAFVAWYRSYYGV